MIAVLLLLLTVPIGGIVYLLHSNYENVYKKYQVIFQSHRMLDTPEVQVPITLQLESGSVPTWLRGIMYRIGPGKFNIPRKDGSTFSIKHAFDGLPFMHRFEIKDQTLIYNSRMLAKSVERKIYDQKDKGLIFFGHIPVMSFPQWILQFLYRLDLMLLRPNIFDTDIADGGSVGVTATPNFPLPKSFVKDDQPVLVSKTDANKLQKIHAETLVPEKMFDYTTYDDKLKGVFAAAHHQYDPNTKEIFNFTSTFAPKPRMIVFSTDQDGKSTVLADISHRSDKSPIQATYVHSLWLTEHYVIIPESPLVYHDKGKNFLLNGSVLSSMTWVDQAPTWFHIISRSGQGLVASIPAPGFFTFHTGNAFDSVDPETGDILLTLDSASFADGDIMSQMHSFGTPHRKGHVAPDAPATSKLNGIAFPPKRQVCFGDYIRYKLNLTRQMLISQDVLAKNLEFPRFNQQYAMKANGDIAYGCQLKAFTEKTDETNGLIKINATTGEILRYGIEGFSCSEPIFVPKPNTLSQDDGVLLTLTNNFDRCYLIIVNALDMKEIARFKIGQFVAVTFHGSYVDHEFESVNVN